jgi:N utilization substance protein B
VSARTKARKRALDVLFECEARRLPLGATLEQREQAAAADPREPGVTPYTVELVRGVAEHQQAIDARIAAVAERWDLDRMPAVDRNLLRLAVFELLWQDDVPDVVAIDEAVSLATDLSTDESPQFVNGVLARIVRDKASSAQNGGTSWSPEDAAVEPVVDSATGTGASVSE